MSTTRRGFAKLLMGAATAFTFASTLAISACNVFKDIMNYVPVGLQAFQAVVDLLSGAGVIPIPFGAAIDIIIAAVKAALADVQTAVTNYENAPAAGKTTLLGKISTALADAQGSLQSFWNDLKIPDPKLEATIEGLCGIILSTLAGFAANPALPAPVVTETQKKASSVSRKVAFTPKKRTVKEFKEDFNHLLTTSGYPAVKF